MERYLRIYTHIHLHTYILTLRVDGNFLAAASNAISTMGCAKAFATKAPTQVRVLPYPNSTILPY